MYCILVTGIPAAGKTTMAEFLAKDLNLPVISKDKIKEVMFDDIGFQSRAEKVKLGVASMDIMYYLAGQLMKTSQPFILENNFENSSKEGLLQLLDNHDCKAVTVTMTGDYKVIYQRFLERNSSPDRHRGHVVNTCYPEKEGAHNEPPLTYESYLNAIESRGMDTFTANGPHIVVDTTDFKNIHKTEILDAIKAFIEDNNND